MTFLHSLCFSKLARPIGGPRRKTVDMSSGRSHIRFFFWSRRPSVGFLQGSLGNLRDSLARAFLYFWRRLRFINRQQIVEILHNCALCLDLSQAYFSLGIDSFRFQKLACTIVNFQFYVAGLDIVARLTAISVFDAVTNGDEFASRSIRSRPGGWPHLQTLFEGMTVLLTINAPKADGDDDGDGD